MSRRSFKLPCNIIPRDYQRTAVDHVHHLLTTDPTTWHLFSSPTGTGKSIVELMILSEVEDSIMITPRLEIIAGMLQKMNDYDPKWNDLKLVEHAWNRYGIITPIRLRNLLARGDVEFMPSCLVIDECFVAGTMISSPNGVIPIDSIKVGDTVLAFNEIDGRIYERKVTRVFKNPMPNDMYNIDMMTCESIVCTPSHPLYSRDEGRNGEWKPAGNLIQSEDSLLVKTKYGTLEWLDIDFAVRCRYKGGDGFVYNIEVEEFHTYIANGIVVHNCHHDSAETYQDITMYLNGCPKVGLTATPYRGTPKQTNVFHKQWGDTVNQVLSLADAVEMGFYQIPDTTIWPLIDDDTVDISNGDFKVKHVEAKLRDCYELIVSNCEPFIIREEFDEGNRILWDMPTIFAMPETESVNRLAVAFRNAGIAVNVVTQATSRFDRIKAFEECVNCTAALIQINVVSEGVDLPIRRVIDCAPTMSPVRWMQQVGRIRPSNGVPPEYICCCRNLERHCYLWEGLLPNAKVAEAQSAFTDADGNPIFSKRSGTRVVGLEGLGRFTTTDVHLNNGTIGFMYNLVHVNGTKRTEYIAFVHPNNPDPVYGIKESAKKEDGTLDWGRWALIESIPDVSGCVSAKINPLTDKQIARWKQSAEGKGLDPHREVNTREFQLLPFLRDTGLSFRT